MSSATQAAPRQANFSGQNAIESRVNELISYIQQGRIIDAMHEFYADDAQMQENNNPPTVGLQANLERERQFVASVKQWLTLEIDAVAIDAARGKALVQSRFSYEGVDGKTYRADQVSVQTWRDGKIVHEKFYYDTGAAK